MRTYFYTDSNGERQGPVYREQLKELAINGIIIPTTLVETKDGFTMCTQTYRDLDSSFATKRTDTQTSSGFFDIGFTRFITNTWISFIWVVFIILSILGCGGAMVFGASNNAPVLFIIAPIAAILFLLFMRMSFELTIVLFRIETHLRTIRDKYENK